MVLAYEALHTANYVYRDAGGNVILKSNGYCCLTDFGLTTVASALKGTRGYWAPEMVRRSVHLLAGGRSADVTELITGKTMKQLQKFKNLDDKVKIVEAGGVDDATRRDIEAKLGAATDDDGKVE